MFHSLLSLVVSIHQCHSLNIPWDYDEPDKDTSKWVEHWPRCGGMQQSPINIITTDLQDCQEPLLLNWVSESSHFGIRNNGHTMHAIPFEINHRGGSDIAGLEITHHTNDTNIRLKNSFYNTFKSRVNSEYCFDSLHFHWGATNEFGSEHFIDNKSYPLEVHLVHYSCDFPMINPALTAYASGNLSNLYDDDHILAVIGVLFELGTEPNKVLDKILSDLIIDGVRKFHDPEDANDGLLELFYTEFDMMDLLPENKEMLAYVGSLTTPPCYETVRWHVMRETMSVTQTQLDAFRMLLESTDKNDSMAPNWRPVQEMNDRSIYECMHTVKESSVEKDAIVEEVVNITDEYNYYNEYKIWFICAVLFICLFVVSVVIIGYLSYLLHVKANNKDGKGKYQQAGSMSSLEARTMKGTKNNRDEIQYH